MSPALPKPGNCHACGYDLIGRAPRDICPECGTPFDIRPDAPASVPYSWIAVIAAALAIVVMPFLALVGMGLVVVSGWAKQRLDRTPPSLRLATRIRARQRLCKLMINAAIFEFFALTLISLLIPDALNWW